MLGNPPAIQPKCSRRVATPLPEGGPGPAGLTGLGRRELLTVVGGVLLVGVIALLDYVTGPHLSFTMFYLIPVAVCAWWGGFAHAILISLAGSLTWSVVDAFENPLLFPTAGVWNGVTHFCTLVLISSLVARLRAGILRERRLARTDPLTGAANGRTFYEAVAAEAERARRQMRPLTLAYLDLDNFKQLNDRLGHAAGDEALLQVVHTLRAHLRTADLLARLGGDEFGLLLPDTESEGAVALLERLQQLVAAEMVRRDLQVTLSVGAITFDRPLLDVDVMVQQVDALMYRAKTRGKGRVEHAAIQTDDESPRGEKAGPERRATARVLCNNEARVRTEGAPEDQEAFATVRNISAEGVRLYLDRAFSQGTVVIVEPLSPGARTLLARVLYANQEGGGWAHGCSLSARLSEQELRAWLVPQSQTTADPLATSIPSPE